MKQEPSAILDHLASLADTTRSRHAAAARSARADGVGAVRHHAAAAVDRQPPSQGAGGQRLDRGARRRHEPPLHDDPRRARRGRRAGCGCSCASRSRRRRRPPGSAPPAGGARRAPHQVAGVLLLVGRPVGSPARRAVRRPLRTSRRWPRSPTRDWVVGDLGCGTGQVSAALAPFVARVIAVDASAEMLQAARARLHGSRQRRSPPRRLEALPIDDERLDVAT